jgi:DNA-binding GntR family transcriptional regulator
MALPTAPPRTFIQQQNLVEQVADYLTQAIIQQHFLPGERLSEVQLSRDLGVSRAPVREGCPFARKPWLADLKTASWLLCQSVECR